MPANALDHNNAQITQPPRTAAPINVASAEAAWSAWMGRNSVTESSFATGRTGKTIHNAAQKRSPDAAYPVANCIWGAEH
jgi:hypothetical protein